MAAHTRSPRSAVETAMKMPTSLCLKTGALWIGAMLALQACSSMYYSTLETFGVEKRDILADRVRESRDDQLEAKEQFQTTLEAFKELTGFEGGGLEDVYDRLSGELSRCEDDATAVTERIRSIEKVAEDLFDEWREENQEYGDASLATASDKLLTETEERYGKLVGTMKKAEAKMEPVLVAFRDQVRFLKHNLNAQAIASLQDNVVAIERDIDALIVEMEAAIAEADGFIASLG